MPRTAASKTYQARRYVAHPLTTRYGAPRSPQELRTKIRALKRLRFFGAEFWCGINPMIYGYARVSTDGQIVTAQVAALRKTGAGKVSREVASGANTDRAQLGRVLVQLDASDVLTVTRLDRLARSTRDLLNTLAATT